MRLAICGLALLLCACRTTAELEAERDAEFQTLVGGSMADFMRRTSLTPSDMYPVHALATSGQSFCKAAPALSGERLSC